MLKLTDLFPDVSFPGPDEDKMQLMQHAKCQTKKLVDGDEENNKTLLVRTSLLGVRYEFIGKESSGLIPASSTSRKGLTYKETMSLPTHTSVEGVMQPEHPSSQGGTLDEPVSATLMRDLRAIGIKVSQFRSRVRLASKY